MLDDNGAIHYSLEQGARHRSMGSSHQKPNTGVLMLSPGPVAQPNSFIEPQPQYCYLFLPFEAAFFGLGIAFEERGSLFLFGQGQVNAMEWGLEVCCNLQDHITILYKQMACICYECEYCK